MTNTDNVYDNAWKHYYARFGRDRHLNAIHGNSEHENAIDKDTEETTKILTEMVREMENRILTLNKVSTSRKSR